MNCDSTQIHILSLHSNSFCLLMKFYLGIWTLLFIFSLGWLIMVTRGEIVSWNSRGQKSMSFLAMTAHREFGVPMGLKPSVHPTDAAGTWSPTP